MTRMLAFLALAAALTATGGVAQAAGAACPASNPPNELILVGGSNQQAQLGRSFAQSMQVRLANTNGCPLTGNLAGILVAFTAPGSGASGVFASSGAAQAYVGADEQGVANAPPFTANSTVGYYAVEAHSDYGSVEIPLWNTASGLASSITAVGTTNQEASVDGTYSLPLQARVVDANGNPVQGATVAFTIVPGTTGAAASFLGGEPTATTDSSGLATSPSLVTNGTPGRFTATASTPGVSSIAVYTLDNHVATTTLRRMSTRDARATVDTRYRSSLQARLLDASGQPIEGATVTFTITPAENGAAATFMGGTGQATAVTDADGLATVPPPVANKTAGSFTATATAPDAPPVRYVLANVAAVPASITAGVANGESATVRTRFAIPLAATVADANGNPVAHATVTFTAPRHGASGLFSVRSRKSRVARVKTNDKGVAVAPPFSANASAGGYVVVARVRPVRAAVSLMNLVG